MFACHQMAYCRSLMLTCTATWEFISHIARILVACLVTGRHTWNMDRLYLNLIITLFQPVYSVMTPYLDSKWTPAAVYDSHDKSKIHLSNIPVSVLYIKEPKETISISKSVRCFSRLDYRGTALDVNTAFLQVFTLYMFGSTPCRIRFPTVPQTLNDWFWYEDGLFSHFFWIQIFI